MRWRDVADDGQVVGDEQVGQAELALEVLQEVDDLRPHRDVERRHGLVGDDEVGLQGQRPGDADALSLTAGEGVRVTIGGVGGQPASLEQRDDLIAGGLRRLHHGRGRRAARRRAASTDHPRVQRGVRVLEHQLHVAAAGAARSPVVVGDVGALEAGSRPRPGRCGAARRGRRSSCPIRTRRRGRASRPGGRSNDTSSTAWTHLRLAGPRTRCGRRGSARDAVGLDDAFLASAPAGRAGAPAFPSRRHRLRRRDAPAAAARRRGSRRRGGRSSAGQRFQSSAARAGSRRRRAGSGRRSRSPAGGRRRSGGAPSMETRRSSTMSSAGRRAQQARRSRDVPAWRRGRRRGRPRRSCRRTSRRRGRRRRRRRRGRG